MAPFISVNCIIMILFFVGYPLILDACSQEGKTIAGRYLSRAAFIQVPKSSLFSCAAACVSYSICKSFNFEKVSRNCTLNVDNELTGTYVLVDDVNYVYSNIDTWAKDIAGPCRDLQCSQEEKCTVLRNKRSACVPGLRAGENFRVEFVLKETLLNWSDAIHSCDQLGGRLAILDTDEKNHIVQEQSRAAGHEDHIWFGLSDQEEEGVWKWINGTTAVYSYWSDAYSQPNDHLNSEHCGSIIHSDTYNRFGWFDQDCTLGQYFVCEFVRSISR